MKSKIVELQKKHADEKDDEHAEHTDYYTGGGLYSSTSRKALYHQMEPISKRMSVANDSKASLYFTPTDSIEQTQLQLSPIHINYIRENLDSYSGCMKPAPLTARKLFFQRRLMHSADDDAADAAESMQFRPLEQTYSNGCASATIDDDDLSETESTIMIANENDSSNEDNCASQPHSDYIPMNILCKKKSRIRSDSKDLYYSLENVFDMKPPQIIKLTNDLTNGETSDVQLSNSSASDNCIVDDDNNADWPNGKNTPEKEIATTTNSSMSHLIHSSQSGRSLNDADATANLNELYPSSSLPNIKRISALADVHCSKDYNGTHVILTVESTDAEEQSNAFGLPMDIVRKQ